MPEQPEAPREYEAVYRKGKWMPVGKASGHNDRKDPRRYQGSRVHNPRTCILCLLEGAAKDADAR